MLVIHHGLFGREAARRLGASDASMIELGDFLRGPPRNLAGERLFLLSGVPAYDAFRQFARAVEKSGAQWTLGYVNGSQVVCGPRFGPPPGPCFDCYMKRTLSHAGTPAAGEQELALGNYYSVNLARDHQGYASTAAWAMAEYCRRISDGGRDGLVVRFGILEVEMTAGRIIPVHGCPKCRPNRLGPRRFVDTIRPFLPRGDYHGN